MNLMCAAAGKVRKSAPRNRKLARLDALRYRCRQQRYPGGNSLRRTQQRRVAAADTSSSSSSSSSRQHLWRQHNHQIIQWTTPMEQRHLQITPVFPHFSNYFALEMSTLEISRWSFVSFFNFVDTKNKHQPTNRKAKLFTS